MSASYMVDFGHTVTGGMAILPQSTDVAVTGTGLDFKEGQEPCNAIVQVGAIVGSGTGITVTFQESDALASGYAAMAQGAQTVTVLEGAIGYLMFFRTKRYVRATVAVNGGGTGYNIAVAILAQKIMTGTGGGSTNLPQS